MGSLRYLSDDDVRAALDIGELADALITALVALSAGAASAPPRVAAVTADGLLGAMPGFVPELGLGAKLVTLFPGNGSRTLATHQAVIASFDPETGSALALLDGTYITAIRTAVTSALAARALARDDSPVVAIVGTGVQAGSHVVAFTELLTVGEIRVAGRSRAKAEAVAATHGLAHAVDSIDDAVRGADIVCCCTDARDPIVEDEWIADGTHVSSVGSGRELAPPTIERGFLVVESAVSFQPPPAGAVELQGRDPATATQLGTILATGIGRPSSEAVTVFKSTGHAVEDVAATSVVVRRAAALGLGTVLG
jgi:ornithine cyclodeaminase/alanine dehydrogenase-like protein (mu-crystallin family)